MPPTRADKPITSSANSIKCRMPCPPVDGKVTIDGKEQKDVITTDGNVIKYNVVNQQKGLLPSTGGQGIRHLMEFALLVIGLSALVGGIYVYRNRKELN